MIQEDGVVREEVVEGLVPFPRAGPPAVDGEPRLGRLVAGRACCVPPGVSSGVSFFSEDEPWGRSVLGMTAGGGVNSTFLGPAPLNFLELIAASSRSARLAR